MTSMSRMGSKSLPGFRPIAGAMTHLVGEESMVMMRKAVGSGFRPSDGQGHIGDAQSNHRKNTVIQPPGLSRSGGVSFIRTTPLPPRVVATSKIGRKDGLKRMATTDFSPDGIGVDRVQRRHQQLPTLGNVRFLP